MSLDSITLKISTPTEQLAPGRGFYQLEEDILYVQIGKFSSERKFYSYIESESLRLDIDKSGYLIFLEYKIPRRQWPVDDKFSLPKTIESADLRWIDFRERVGDPVVVTNKLRTKICFRFSDKPPKYSFYLAESVFLQMDKNDHLVAIWIDDITDDIAGKEIAAFRKKVRGRNSFFRKPAHLK
ncbi:MAG: hypothetical protein ABIJ12_00300 [bacterium]